MVNIFQEYPFCRDNRTKLKAILMDTIPAERAKIHLLLHAYDEGIKTAIDDATILDNLFVYRWTKRLVDSCGSSKENAEWTVTYWVENYGIQCLRKPKMAAPELSHDIHKSQLLFQKPDIKAWMRTMPIIVAVDTSISTRGEIIGALNKAFSEFLPDLCELQEDQYSVNFTMRTLSISSEPKWNQNTFVDVEDFCWNDLLSNGRSEVGEAFNMLTEQLENLMQKDSQRMLAPTIIFAFASIPTDDYNTALERLKNTRLFKYSERVAVAVGENVDEHLLEQLTGDRELILQANNFPALIKLIKAIDRFQS